MSFYTPPLHMHMRPLHMHLRPLHMRPLHLHLHYAAYNRKFFATLFPKKCLKSVYFILYFP
jgi:hypothetical protein